MAEDDNSSEPVQPHIVQRVPDQELVLPGPFQAALIPQKINESLQLQARHIFLQDMVVPTPISSALSHGHFSKLATLLESSPRPDYLHTAVDAVALTTLVTRFGMSDVRPLARSRYIATIRHIRAQTAPMARGTEYLVATMSLLSLYEMLNADVIDNLNCIKHLQGIMAIARTRTEDSQQPIFGVEQLVLSTDPPGIDPLTVGSDRRRYASRKSRKDMVLASLPPVTMSFTGLVSKLTEVAALFRKAGNALDSMVYFETELKTLGKEAAGLRSDLLAWSSLQTLGLRPMTVKRFTRPYTMKFANSAELVCPTFRADCYTDYVVANIWTSYRQCQIHLADLICRINKALCQGPKEYSNAREVEKLRKEIASLIDDTYASIAFMLVGDIRFCDTEGAVLQLPKPPMLLGGLNMQWILSSIATLEHASEESRSYARSTLVWFGRVLGIGQATVLANMYEKPPGGLFSKGDAIRWSGFLT